MVIRCDGAVAAVSGTAVPLLQVLCSEGCHVFRPGLKNALQQQRYHRIHLTTIMITTMIIKPEDGEHGMIRKEKAPKVEQ